ncbi:MAG: transcription termination/antitermination protein NusA [Deltaproteobacteria bacterium]|nr:transcription termination/antitermination protein NusA [Deltaproteobacteria bacterium]
MLANLAQIIEQVGKDKGIDKDVLISALEAAMLKAAEKRFGQGKIIEAHFNPEEGEIELFIFKTVVEEVGDPDIDISLKEAHEYDPEAEFGDSLGLKLDSKEFGRIDAQTAKQIIIQKVRDAERDIVFNEYSEKKGEIITGVVQRFERGDIVIDLGRTEAIMPKKEQVRREGYRQGERIRGMVLDVKADTRGPQVLMSRTHPGFLTSLFQMEVPEIYEGIVEIRAAAREPGDRAKIAVISNNPDVDPVGACVGVKGSRVQSVVQELKGEKIDIVHFSEDPAMLAKNALSPAQISKVIIDDAEHIMEVIVPDDQLSLAIGKRGQNVRLAAKLTGWKIDILTDGDNTEGKATAMTPDEALKMEVEAASVAEAKALGGISELDGVGPKTAVALMSAGYESVEDIANATAEDLEKVEGIGKKKAEAIVEAVLALG